ncbi:MAG: hypothetical protein RRA45_06085 [Saccharolobus sp.]|jgi:uncharacterized protein YaaR (DUF327 family)|uniref:hypothetical protein n=1 Tax=Saccharolobus sp. TaxID=2100761 RepID=UPI0028CF888E|nr:hypothetical protein [Saccharolobus sp.]MDT7861763.1 hypothetical protein [Saccharolobus sp.]
MNFITFAEKLGINRDDAIKIYRLFNGGYFESLYYSKPPMLNKLRDWPKKYLTKRLILVKTPSLNQAFEALVWLDVIAIYGSSAKLTNNPMKYDILNKNIEEVYDKIREYSLNNQISDYPTFSNLDLYKADVSPFINDLVSKRMEEIRVSDIEIISDIAYDSKLMEEIKAKYPWAKNVKRENSIRAFQLSDKVSEFMDYILPYIYYLASSKTFYFDQILINNTLSYTIQTVEREGENAVRQGIINNDYQRKVKEIYDLIVRTLNYF